jgi:hypothetical protein
MVKVDVAEGGVELIVTPGQDDLSQLSGSFDLE